MNRWRDILLHVEFALVIFAQLWFLTAGWARTAPIVPAGRTFTCTPTAVWDGDGPIWCKEGPRVRLAGIAARERDGSCRRGHPCPAASGLAARDRLVALLGGPRGTLSEGHVRVAGPLLACRSSGPDRYARTLAACRLDGRDLSQSLIATGVALPWRRRAG